MRNRKQTKVFSKIDHKIVHEINLKIVHCNKQQKHQNTSANVCLMSVRKNTVAWSSVLSKLWSFSKAHQWNQNIVSWCIIENDHNFERTENVATVLLIWKIDDFINSFWLYLTFSLVLTVVQYSCIGCAILWFLYLPPLAAKKQFWHISKLKHLRQR